MKKVNPSGFKDRNIAVYVAMCDSSICDLYIPAMRKKNMQRNLGDYRMKRQILKRGRKRDMDWVLEGSQLIPVCHFETEAHCFLKHMGRIPVVTQEEMKLLHSFQIAPSIVQQKALSLLSCRFSLSSLSVCLKCSKAWLSQSRVDCHGMHVANFHMGSGDPASREGDERDRRMRAGRDRGTKWDHI